MVAGGSDVQSTEVFSLETQTWRPGPDLPYPLIYSGTVDPFGEMVLTGGRQKDIWDTVYYDQMLKLDTTQEPWQWLELFSTLPGPTGPRAQHVAINLGDSFRLTYVENDGAFMSWGSDFNETIRTWALKIFPVIMLIGLFFYTLFSKTLNWAQSLSFSFILSY